MKILITGGTSGIGNGIAKELSKNHQILVLDKKEPKETNFDFYKINLLHTQEIFDFFKKKSPEVDAVINVAGIREIVSPAHLRLELWEDVFNINVTVPFLLSQYAIKQALEKNKSLSIVNIASISGFLAEPNRAAYVSSKHALIGLTKQLAYQYGKNGIRVNAIAPGIIETEMTKNYFTDRKITSLIKKETPLGTWGQTEHLFSLVEVCLFNQYMTGAILTCDGGWSCGKTL